MGPPQTRTCQRDFDTLLALREDLEVPLAKHKMEGLCTHLSFFGIKVDPVGGELRLHASRETAQSQNSPERVQQLQSVH